MNDKDKLAIIIGCLFNQAIPAKEAWSVPYKLAERYLKVYNKKMTFNNMYHLSAEELLTLITLGKSLHRFPNKMAYNLHNNIHLIKDHYGGIDQFFVTNEAELLQRLISLKGIGRHKAQQAVILYAAINPDFVISTDTLSKAYAECRGSIINIERDKALILKM